MNEDFIDGIYNNPERPGLYKGYSILAGDTSICDAPNIGYTEKQLKKLNNPHFNRLRKELIRFRASCIADTQTDFILTSTITNSKKNRRSRTRNATFRQFKPKNRYDQHYHNIRQRI